MISFSVDAALAVILRRLDNLFRPMISSAWCYSKESIFHPGWWWFSEMKVYILFFSSSKTYVKTLPQFLVAQFVSQHELRVEKSDPHSLFPHSQQLWDESQHFFNVIHQKHPGPSDMNLLLPDYFVNSHSPHRSMSEPLKFRNRNVQTNFRSHVWAFSS